MDFHAALLDLARSERGEGRPVQIFANRNAVGWDAENGSVELGSGVRYQIWWMDDRFSYHG